MFVTTPNNPTGTATPLEVVAAVCDAAPGVVVVDEAYAEFAAAPSAVTLLERYPRLLVSRTMSKAFAMAGTRLGYLAAAPAVVDALRLVRLPYHLSALTQVAARTALAHTAELLGSVAEVVRQRDRMVEGLHALGLSTRADRRELPALRAVRRPAGDLAAAARRRRAGPGRLRRSRARRLAAGLRRDRGRDQPVPVRRPEGPVVTAPSTARRALVERTTKESEVRVEIDLDGTGQASSDTGVPFFDHMVAQLGKHGGFDLAVRTRGDLEVDAHHTVEDTSLALGQALREALGDKAGLRRFGDALVPLDECLVQAAVDLSGRPYLVHDEPQMVRADRQLRHHAGQAHLGVLRRDVADRPARAGDLRAQRAPRRRGAVQGGRAGAARRRRARPAGRGGAQHQGDAVTARRAG